MGGEDPVASVRGAEGRDPRDAPAPSAGDSSRAPREAPRSSPVVPSLNLAVAKEHRQMGPSRSKSQVIDESRVHSDSKVINEAMRRREIESFKVKINLRRDREGNIDSEKDKRESNRGKEAKEAKEWGYLTSSNLKECAKAYASTSSRHDAMRRVKQWIQQSNPPYESNPSPGIPALMTSPHPRKKRFSLDAVTLWWQTCRCIHPRTR